MPTLADIARVAGCSKFTVSCALRGLSSVSASTRERIQRIAEQMDYRPNGAAALLALQRKRLRGDGGLIPVAGLGVPRWELIAQNGVWTGFVDQCARLGMKPVPFSPAECSKAGLPRLLWNQGVQGIFLFQRGIVELNRAAWTPEQWSRFHVVKQGRVAKFLAFDLVRHSAFDYMIETLTRVVARGYRRIAVIISASLSPEDNLARVGAALGFRTEALPSGGWLDVWRVKKEADAEECTQIVGWLTSHRAQVVVGFPFGWHATISEFGLSIPDAVTFAALMLPPALASPPSIAGCDAKCLEYGTKSANLMFELLRNGRRGLQEKPVEEVIEPSWIDGLSLPPRRKISTQRKGRSRFGERAV